MIKIYETKPCTIEAIQFIDDNIMDILDWSEGAISIHHNVLRDNDVSFLIVETLEGKMKADKGDFIIKGLREEFYPCKPDVFHKKYKEINN